MKTTIRNRAIILIATMVIITAASTYMRADTGTCGGASITLPFTDVPAGNVFFCSIAEAYFSALTNGTSPTTYSPADTVTREQMAAFTTRTMDQSLKRGSKRAALQQFWTTTPRYLSAAGGLGGTLVGGGLVLIQSDGEDLWAVGFNGSTVFRVHASTGKLLDTWTTGASPFGVLVAMGRVFVTGSNSPGNLYMIDPTGIGGAAPEVTGSGLGINPEGIAFDGSKIWTANAGTLTPGTGSVSIITPGMTTPWSVTNVPTGFVRPRGILFDGSNIWVTDSGANALLKLDQNGSIIQTVAVSGSFLQHPAFDGTNIWVPSENAVTVVRASTGVVLATLTGNGLNSPRQVAFDGQRILVTNSSGNSVSLWKSADLTPIGTFSTGVNSGPIGACSDGTYFWIAMYTIGTVGRF